MTMETLQRSANDYELQGRINSAIAKEVWANPEFGDTAWGQWIKQYGPAGLQNYFSWPISIDNEEAYEYAVNSGNEHPGQDPGVISDANLSSGVQTHWPDDSTAPTTPTP